MGLENLLLMGALVLLAVFRRQGGSVRYVTALILGIVPLTKLSGGVIGATALAGFLLDRAIQYRRRAWREAVLALLIPAATAACAWWWTERSWDTVVRFLKASGEIMSGYSTAMSLPSSAVDFMAAAEALVIAASLLFFYTRGDHGSARFYTLLFAAPLAISFKHAFVRGGSHMVNLFCFLALAMGLVLLTAQIARPHLRRLWLILLLFALLWQDRVLAWHPAEMAGEVAGVRALPVAWHALRGDLRAWLDRSSLRDFSPEYRIEPEIRSIVQDHPVASLSVIYNGAWLDGLRIQVYPVIQRYSAYTAYLDKMNAAWIRERGPRFLIFDGWTIDDRHWWAETPATWLEVYRWYNTRMLGSRNILLERRAAPRFTRLERVGRFQRPLAGELEIPASPDPIFWSLRCGLNGRGRLRKLLLWIPEINMKLLASPADDDTYRALPEVLSSPVMGNRLPSTLQQLASLLDDGAAPRITVRKLAFSGPGIPYYTGSCECEFWRAVKPSEDESAALGFRAGR